MAEHLASMFQFLDFFKSDHRQTQINNPLAPLSPLFGPPQNNATHHSRGKKSRTNTSITSRPAYTTSLYFLLPPVLRPALGTLHLRKLNRPATPHELRKYLIYLYTTQCHGDTPPGVLGALAHASMPTMVAMLKSIYESRT